MALIVQKYGGTSVGDFNNPFDMKRLENLANNIRLYLKEGHKLVIVLSAMSNMTNTLVKIAKSANSSYDKREGDALFSIGEQMSVALFGIILKKYGIKAISLNAFQVGMKTNSTYGSARIEKIHRDMIQKYLDEGNVVVVAGFQGVDKDNNLTTLGRGGSDTSAVAIAAALKADECEIYTDVDGVYTADPNVCSSARKLKTISYDEMLEMASLGAKVLQIRSVSFAKKYNVKINVRSSFLREEGTMVVSDEENMEALTVSGVVSEKNQSRITFKKVPDVPGIAAKIFGPLANAKILVDMIIQNTRASGKTDLTFTVKRDDFEEALKISERIKNEVQAEDLIWAEKIAKISVVGLGMKNYSGVAAKMFEVLAENNINIFLISTSEIRISCAILEEYTELAVRKLHTAFGLDKEEDKRIVKES